MAAEGIVALPDKEVVSILDLAADIDLAIDGAAPIDLAVALNANVVAPIDAAVSANLLSDGSTAQAMSDQGVQITQLIEADASATAIQDSTIDQSDALAGEPAGGVGAEEATAAGVDAASAPADGSIVVDSAGTIIGTLDADTGNVVSADGSILGTLNETTGLVVDSAGNLVGTVTDLVDGATVVGSNGQVLGVLDAATGNVLDSAGNVVGAVNPVTGQVLDAAGNLIGVVEAIEELPAGIDTGDLLEGDLLHVDVNVDLDADLSAPINGAVAANANVAAPIDASVAANILSENSEAVAIAQQDAIITQSITGNAEAMSDQVSEIDQAEEPVDSGTAPADEPAVATQEPVDGGTAPADEPAVVATQEPATDVGTTTAADEPTS